VARGFSTTTTTTTTIYDYYYNPKINCAKDDKTMTALAALNNGTAPFLEYRLTARRWYRDRYPTVHSPQPTLERDDMTMT
jgi:hypothetical protein